MFYCQQKSEGGLLPKLAWEENYGENHTCDGRYGLCEPGSRRILCSKRMGGLRAEPEQQEAAEGCEADRGGQTPVGGASSRVSF